MIAPRLRTRCSILLLCIGIVWARAETLLKIDPDEPVLSTMVPPEMQKDLLLIFIFKLQQPYGSTVGGLFGLKVVPAK